MNEVNVDLISNGQAKGDIASFIQTNKNLNILKKRPYLGENGIPCVTIFKAGGDPKDPYNIDNELNYQVYKTTDLGLTVNADTTLRPEEWEELDEAVREVAREELTVYDYFVGQNMTKTLRNGFGTSVMKWQSISDSQEAIMTMDAINRSQGDRVQYKEEYWPVPIISSDYQITKRFLEISRNQGNGVDIEEAQNAARRIMEKKEDLIIGTSAQNYTFGGGTSYTLLTYPNRNQVVLNGDWNASTTTAANIVDDVRNLKRANKDAYHGGEGVLIIPDDYEDKLGEDYSVSGGSLMTIKERIMKLGGIRTILVSERLSDNNVLFVELKKRSFEIVKGMDMQNIVWENEGGMVSKHKLMEITFPRMRSDYNLKCGIAHGATS